MEIILSGISACVAFVALILSYFSFSSTEKAQQQNVNVQLFKMRYEVYLLLQSWKDKANNVFGENKEELFYKMEAFKLGMLRCLDDIELLSYTSKMRELDGSSNNPNDVQQIVENAKKQRKYYQDKCTYIVISAKTIQRKINSAAYLFSLDEEEVNKIKGFTSIYFDITEKIAGHEERGDKPNNEQQEKLKDDFKKLRELNNGVNGVVKILETMEEQLDALRISFSEQ